MKCNGNTTSSYYRFIAVLRGLKIKKKNKKNVHGQFSLQLNQSYKWVGIVCCFIGSFLLNVAISHWNEEIYLMASFAILLFFGIGIAILVGYYNFKVVFDGKKIKGINGLGKERTIAWDEIENVKFNRTSGYLKLYIKSGKIVVLKHSVGFVEFIRVMESKTRFRTQELKIPY